MKTFDIKRLAIGTILGALCLAFIGTAGAAPFPVNPADFRNDMNKLWEDHITRTRLYIVSALTDLPDKDATAKSLLQNQADIGNAFRPFYGDAAAEQLTALLKDHILIAVVLIDAAKADDTAKQEDAAKRWHKNADEIATFLSGLNRKNWPPEEMRTMMHEHLDVTTAEVVAILKKDRAAEIMAYDKVREQILKMADMLSTGIINQFPDKFQK